MPDRKASANDASRQVGAVDDTASPTAAPHASITTARPAPATAPAKMAPHPISKRDRSRVSTVSRGMASPSTQAEERQNRHDHNDQSDQINQATHRSLPAGNGTLQGPNGKVPLLFRLIGTQQPRPARAPGLILQFGESESGRC